MTGRLSDDRKYSKSSCRKFVEDLFSIVDNESRSFEGMAGVSRSQPRRPLLWELRNIVLLIVLRFAIWSTVADAHGQREHPFRRREL